MAIRQSVCVPMFQRGEPAFERLFPALHDIGYAAVEFWDRGSLGDFERVFALARENGLAVASISGHESLPDGLNRRENHERIEAELRASIDLAAQHTISGLICFSGNRNAGQSDLEGMVACAEGLKRVAAQAERKGVNLNVELLNSRIDHPGYQCDRSDWGVALCELVGSPRVKLLFDIYHMQIMEGDLIRTIRKIVRHIGHFHTAGNPGRNELDDDQELDYRGICRAIAASGYGGFVGHEFRPRGEVLEALRAAFATCDV